jgi:hypothetical protein
MNTDRGSSRRSTAEKRNEISRATQTKAVRAAIHDVGIFIGVLFAVDKVVDIWSRSPLASAALIIIAVGFVTYVIISRVNERKAIQDLEKLVRDEAESETNTDDGDD